VVLNRDNREDRFEPSLEDTNSEGTKRGFDTSSSTRRNRRRVKRATAISVATPMAHYNVPSTHRPFAHPSEDEFTNLLDFYGVKWLYEPRSFPLKWEGDRVLQMFTPDFYLPEFDLYVELTTLKQNLVTVKNRKMRQIQELYPDVNIKLLYRRDIYRLLAKYGFGPLVQETIPAIDKVLFTKPEIDRRVKHLGKIITKDYKNDEPIFLGVLSGVFCFMADLIREVDLPIIMDFMSVSYYGESAEGLRTRDGTVEITKGPDVAIEGRRVLLIEDIVDTGMTLNYLLRYLESFKPADIKVCTLLDKKVRRLVDVQVEYTGFEVPDEFVVGYGLDYLQKYRNLPFIGILKPEEQPQVREENLKGITKSRKR